MQYCTGDMPRLVDLAWEAFLKGTCEDALALALVLSTATMAPCMLWYCRGAGRLGRKALPFTRWTLYPGNCAAQATTASISVQYSLSNESLTGTDWSGHDTGQLDALLHPPSCFLSSQCRKHDSPVRPHESRCSRGRSSKDFAPARSYQGMVSQLR